MPSNKRKSETIEILAGGSNKKPKTPIKDPFADRYKDVVVEIFNLNMPEICEKLFLKSEVAVRYEVKCYRFEIQGVSKTVCGESCFLEESKATITITFEAEKKDEFIALLQDRFPSCTYQFK